MNLNAICKNCGKNYGNHYGKSCFHPPTGQDFEEKKESEMDYICSHLRVCGHKDCGGQKPKTMATLVGLQSILRHKEGAHCSVSGYFVKAIPYRKKNPMKFKIGDKVILTTNEYVEGKSNPIWGGKYGETLGTVIEITSPDLPIRVQWDTNETNSYEETDLTLYKEETPMEYELLKPITLEAMVEAGAQETCSDFQAFVLQAMKAGHIWNSAICASDALEWRKTRFLFDKGFIREKVDNPFKHVVVEISDTELCIKLHNNYIASLRKEGLILYGGNDRFGFETDDKGRIKIVE